MRPGELSEIVDPFAGIPMVLALVLAPPIAYGIVQKARRHGRDADPLWVALVVAALGALGLAKLG